MRKKVIVFYFLIFFTSAGILLSADIPEELYKKGNLAYENKDYEKAISIYEGLINMDRISPEVFYNLGNGYFKLKRIGKAILNYERALRFAPRDRDIQLNLKLARAMAIDKIDTHERGFISNAALFLYDRMNINELTIAASIFYFLAVLFLIFSIFFISKRKVLIYVAGSIGTAFFIFILFLTAKTQSENFIKTGVIVAEKIDVRSGPKEDYLLQFSLHEGTKVKIVKRAQGWYEIDLSKDLKGWIPEASVDII